MKSVLKDGVLYSCIDYNSHTLGPGYYNIPESLIKKSFNARVSGGNTPRSSRGRSKTSSSNSSPLGISVSALAKQRNKSFSAESSPYKPLQFPSSPRKNPLTVFTGSDTPPKNATLGGSLRSTTHSTSSYSNIHHMGNSNNSRQQFIYRTPS